MSLCVEVCHENVRTSAGELSGQVNGRCGFSRSPFLVQDRISHGALWAWLLMLGGKIPTASRANELEFILARDLLERVFERKLGIADSANPPGFMSEKCVVALW